MQPGRARLQDPVQIDCHPALHQPCQRSGLASSPASAQQVCLSHWDQGHRRDRSLRRRNAAKYDTTTAQCLTTRPALVNTPEYRRNVGICLVNSEGLVFAARRVDDSQGTWQMPQGGIDPCENPFVAAARELLEETGIRSIEFVAQIDQWIDYEFPTTVQSALTGCWTMYKGQTQKWMLFKFCGNDSEIDLDFADKEFLEYKWAELHDLPDKVVYFKQHIYQLVVLEFGPHIERIKKAGTT